MKISLILFFLIFTAVSYADSNSTKKQKWMSVSEKKENFRRLVVPAVNEVYNELQMLYSDISANINNKDYSLRIQKLKKTYKAKSDEELLMALKPHPKSIAIAQAAMESAWLTSRFFYQANNIFGVWSMNKNEPRVPALRKRGNVTIWVKKYATIKESIADYYRVVARSKAFTEFRKLKMQTDDPYELVKRLDTYSEMGAKYGEALRGIIKYNKFYLYDK